MVRHLRTLLFIITFFLGAYIVVNFMVARAINQMPTIKLGVFYPAANRTPSPAVNPQAYRQNQASSRTDANGNPIIRLIYFSQRDPAWKDFPGRFPDILRCGCGPTTAAQILAGYLDKSGDPFNGPYNPPGVWNAINAIGAQLNSSCGVEITYLQKVLNNYGFNTHLYNLPTTNKYLVEQEFKRWTDAGNLVIAMMRINGIGHYTLITSVDANGTPWVYDAYYGFSQPFHPQPVETNRYYQINYEYLVIKK
jgi:hypothetical protein